MRTAATFLVFALAFGQAPELPQFHGEDGALRKAMRLARYSRLNDGHTWTYGSIAITAVLYPRRHDVRLSEVPKGVVPWRPVAISRFDWKKSPEAQEVIERSTIILVLRAEDGTTCVVNRLPGERIYKETLREQDVTAVELPCAEIWERGLLPEMPADARQQLTEYLKTPPAPPQEELKTKKAPVTKE